MRKLLYFAFLSFFTFFGVVMADTLTINWLNEDYSPLTTSTCESGGDIVLPSIPTKPGHTFKGWKIKDFIRVEYIENNPPTLVDTGILTTENIRIVADALVLEEGSLFYSSNGSCATGLYTSSSTSIFPFWCELQQRIFTQSGRHVYDLSKDGLYVDNSKVLSLPTKSFSIGNVGIFGTVGTSGSNIVAKTYSVKIYRRDVLVRDFVPAIDSTQTPGFYDLVTKQFFYNTGSGNLIAGPVTE